MCEYMIRITGDQDILVLSPEMIGMLIEKIRLSDTRELTIPVEELLPQGYTQYLENVMRAGKEGIKPRVQKQDIYDLTARQIKLLKVERQQCFEKAEAVSAKNNTEFSLETNMNFFLLTKQTDSRFLWGYEDGEEIFISLMYL